MTPTTRSTSPRRGIGALVFALIVAALPLSIAGTANATCVEGVPQEACDLLPSTPGIPIDNLFVVGQTFVPDTPQVQLNDYLYMSNLDTREHYVVFSSPSHFKKLNFTQAGPVGEKLQISSRNGFVANAVYQFACTRVPTMTGELTVLP